MSQAHTHGSAGPLLEATNKCPKIRAHDVPLGIPRRNRRQDPVTPLDITCHARILIGTKGLGERALIRRDRSALLILPTSGVEAVALRSRGAARCGGSERPRRQGCSPPRRP